MAHRKAKLLLDREGEATITCGKRTFHTQPDDFMLVRPNAACGGSPEPIAPISTIYAEPEFVLDNWRWQLSPFFPTSESMHALGRVFTKVIRARLPEPKLLRSPICTTNCTRCSPTGSVSPTSSSRVCWRSSRRTCATRASR